MIRRLAAAILIVTAMFGIACTGSGGGSTDDAPRDDALRGELLAIGTSYLRARHLVLVEPGRIDEALDSTPMTDVFRADLERELRALDRLRERIAGSGAEYVSVEPTLTALAPSVENGRAVLFANEHTRFTSADPEAPVGESSIDHRFEFVRAADGGWLLALDRVPEVGLLPETVQDPEIGEPG